MNAVVGLLKADNGGWNRKVRERENRQRHQRAVGELVRRDFVATGSRSQGERALAWRGSIEQHAVEFRQPLPEFLV